MLTRKYVLPLLVLLIVIILLPITYFAVKKQQELRGRAAQTKAPETVEPFTKEGKPEYVPGEVLVKLNIKNEKLKIKIERVKAGVDIDKGSLDIDDLDTSEPEAKMLVDFLKQQGVLKLEKVFKGSGDPKEDVAKFKARFPQRAAQVKPEAEQIDLSRTYKLTFEKEIDVVQKVNDLSKYIDFLVYAEPNYIYKTQFIPNDPYFLDPDPSAAERNLDPYEGGWNPTQQDDSLLDYQWNLKKIGMDRAWDYAGTEEVLMAVIDTGVDYNHPELEGKIWENQGEIGVDIQGQDKKTNGIDDDDNGYIDDWQGWDAVDYWWQDVQMTSRHKRADNNPMDDWREPYFENYREAGMENPVAGGHGTHVTGIIASRIDNNVGLSGMNNFTKIIALRGLDAKGVGFSSQLAELINYAKSKSVQIINMSWGGKASQTIADALETAYNAGVVLIAASGNEFPLKFPASHPMTIAVSATNEHDKLTGYSTYGPEIDLSAPGGEGRSSSRNLWTPQSILSLRAERTDMYCFDITICWSGQVRHTDKVVGVDKTYYRASGTSMAAPHVSGLASLILSKNPFLTNEQVKAIMEYSADDLGDAGKDDKFGYGRINAEQALSEFSTNPPPVAIITDPYDQEHLYYGAFEIKGTARSDQFDSFRLEYAPADNPENWQSKDFELANLPFDGITDGLLGIWNSGSLEGKYYLRLSVVDQEGRERSDKVIVELVNHSLKSGWPKTLPNSLIRDPIIADLNNDGRQEIITVDTNTVYAIEEDGQLLRLWSISVQYNRHIVVGEVNPSIAGKEIILGNDTTIEILHQDGSIVTISQMGYFESVLSDLNRDGVEEILTTELISSPIEWKLHALNINGQDITNFPVVYNDGLHSLPVGHSRLRVGDINGDGYEDVVINLLAQTELQQNKVVAISGTGELLWTKTLHTGFGWYTPPLILLDFDLDGQKEVVFYDTYTLKHPPWYAYELYIWRGDGSGFFSENPIDLSEIGDPFTIGGDGGLMHIAEIDEDKNPELLIISSEKFIIIKNDGSVNLKDLPDLLVKPGEETVIGDLDGNDAKEFFTNSKVYMLPQGWFPQITNLMVSLLEYANGNFIVKDGWPKSLISDSSAIGGNGSAQNPAIGDLDGDGKSEIVLQYCLRRKDSCFLYVLETDTEIGALDWPQYLHDERHTGAYTVPAQVNEPIVIFPGWNRVGLPLGLVEGFGGRRVLEELERVCGNVKFEAIGAAENERWSEYVSQFGGEDFPIAVDKDYWLKTDGYCRYQ